MALIGRAVRVVRAEDRLVEHVSVDIRGLPTIPGEKRYLVNDTELLTGYYRLHRNPMHSNSDGASFDVLDLRSEHLFPTVLDVDGGGPLERARYEEVKLWFTSRWEQVSQPLSWGG